MLFNLQQILELADAKRIAIGAFNVNTLQGIQAVLEAAEELKQPVILQYAPVHGAFIDLDLLGPIMVELAEKAKVSVCVHLDHGEELSVLHQALEIGFTSVMYDGSMLSYEENVAYTRLAVEMAAEYGASVEAEIGAMGREEFASLGEAQEGEAISGSYTDPDQAEDFVDETGVDALACSFGTVHGLYLTEPCLDFERIKEIRDRIGIPVVMHGGSGISAEDFGRCIACGVRKINYYTYMAKAGGEYVKEMLSRTEGPAFFHDISVWGKEAMKEEVKKAIQIFSDL